GRQWTQLLADTRSGNADAVFHAKKGTVGGALNIFTLGIHKLVGQPIECGASMRADITVGIGTTSAAHHENTGRSILQRQPEAFAAVFGQSADSARSLHAQPGLRPPSQPGRPVMRSSIPIRQLPLAAGGIQARPWSIPSPPQQ